VARGGSVDDVNRMYVLQHAGIHLALCLAFGASLRTGSTTADHGHGRDRAPALHAELRAYTRGHRRLGGLLPGHGAVSFSLYGLAPWAWWSLFANVLTPLAAATLFVGEHFVRYRRHPDFERVSLRAAYDAYRRPRAAGGGAAP